MKNSQKLILDLLGEKPIAYNSALARLTKSITAGLLLSQLLYWDGKGDDKNWFYKTIEEAETETALSRYEQESAVKKLKSLGIIEVKLKGIPAKRYFKINIEKLTALVKESSLQKNHKIIEAENNQLDCSDSIQSNLLENNKLDSENSTNSVVENPQTNTESTQRLHTENNIYIENDKKPPVEEKLILPANTLSTVGNNNSSLKENNKETPGEKLCFTTLTPCDDWCIWEIGMKLNIHVEYVQMKTKQLIFSLKDGNKYQYKTYHNTLIHWLQNSMSKGEIPNMSEVDILDMPHKRPDKMAAYERQLKEMDEWEEIKDKPLIPSNNGTYPIKAYHEVVEKYLKAKYIYSEDERKIWNEANPTEYLYPEINKIFQKGYTLNQINNNFTLLMIRKTLGEITEALAELK